MYHFTLSFHSKPHTWDACVLSCKLPPALLAEWPGSFYALPWYHRGGTDTEIRVSAKNLHRRRLFSRRSFRDSNPRPFDHELVALPLSHIPVPSLTKRVWRGTSSGLNACMTGNNFCLTSTEAKWPIRDGDKGGKGRESEGSIAGANPEDQGCRGPPPEQQKC